MNKASFTNLILFLFLRIGRFLKNIFSPISFLAKAYIKQTGQLISGNKNTGICLDVGAGIAPYEKNIKKHFGVSSYIPIDVAPSNSTIVATSACCLPFKNSTFNIIVSFDVIQHVQYPNLMVRELYRTLLNDGYILLTYPFLYPECDSKDFNRWTLDGMKNLLISEGFEIIINKRRGGIFFAYSCMLNWMVQHSIPGQRKTWRSQKNFAGCIIMALTFFLTIPTRILSWIALFVDYLVKIDSFYMGGVIVAKKRKHDS